MAVPPVSLSDLYSTGEDTALNVGAPGVLANDTDADPNTTLTAVLDANVSNGTLTLNPDGSFSYVPNPNFNGVDGFTYHANDGTESGLIAAVVITVTPTNDAPVFTNAGPTGASEGTLYTYTMTASDADGNLLSFAAPTLPAWLSFNGTNTISGTPQQANVGAHNVVVTVSDGIAPAVQQSFTITVGNVNDPPVFTNAGPTTANEGVLYTYTMAASDEDGNTLTFAAPTLPVWLSFNGTNTISGTPQQPNVGPHNVVVTVSDGIAPAVQQSFTITVSNVNNAPTFTNAGPTSATEGTLYTYTMTANDGDGDTLTFAAPTLPAWLSFNGTNTISGTPQQANVGPHNVVVTVSDGTAPAVQQSFTITVGNVNDPPVFTNAGPTTANEGVLYTYTMAASDEDGNTLTFAAPTLPAWLSFNGGTSTISGTPQQANVGPHNVVVTVSDGISPAVQQSFTITVSNVNDAPVFTNAGPTTASEGTLYTYTMAASDEDGNTLTFAAPTLPAWLSFNGTNTISGTPQQAHVGPHNVVVTVSDGIAPAVQQSFTITVSNVNDAPVFTNAGPTTASEGTLYTYTMAASDEDGNTLTFAAPTLPTWLSFNGTNAITGTPQQANVGAHSVVVTVSDGIAPAVQQNFTITVGNVNDPPVFTNAGATTANEGTLYTYTMTASDEDGNTLTFAAPTLPTWLSFNGTNAISGTPQQANVGPHNVVVTVSDGIAPAVQQSFTITVSNVNNAPTLVTPIPDQTGTEDGAFGPLNVAANFTDADGDALTFTATGFPTGSGLSISAAGVISGTPTNDAAKASPFNVTVTATASDGSVNDTFQFTVTNVNDAPTAVADSYTTSEDTTLTVAAPGVLGNDTDPDAGATTLTAVLDTNVANGTLTLNANGSFSYVPKADFNGADSFTYHASDGTASSNVVTVSITVTAGNDAPVAAPDTYSTAEDTLLTIAATGVLGNDTDADAGTTLTAVLGTTTVSGTLVLSANGSFSYMPNLNFSGTDSFTYQANDGTVGGNVVTVTITVNPVNDPPFVTSAPQTSVAEDVTYSYTMTATDPDGNPLTFAAPILPSWLVFTAPATISGTPTQNNIGVHNVTMTVSDGTAPAVSQPFQITVTSVDDAPVIAALIPDQTATELIAYSLNLATFVTDADTPASGLTYVATTPLPSGLTLSPAGLLSGTPSLGTSVGDFTVGFTVSDGPNTIPRTFHLTVLRAGRADLAVTATAAPNPVATNATAAWTFTITNNAPQVEVGGVSLRAVFTGSVPFQFATPPSGCTVALVGSETQVTCTLGRLSGGATTTVTLSGSAALPGDVFGTATVAIVGPVPVDETTRNDTATASLSVARTVTSTPAQGITGLDARAAAAGDLNGDGFVDLAVATGPAQSTMVLLNVVDPSNPNKRVLSSTPIAIGGQAVENGIVLADLDGDSDLDIVTATGAGATNGVYLNSGSGTFSAFAVGDATENSRAVAAADINGDSRIDLVFANGSPSTVYTNQGSGGVFARTGAIGNADSRGVVLANLLADPLPELVLANGDGDAAVYRNVGGVFQFELALQTGPTTSVAAADFNNDGRIDLVFGRSVGATPGAAPSNLVWLNSATGTFVRAAELGASATTGVAITDIDLDGDPDILAMNGAGGLQSYLNAGNAFTLGAQQITATGALAAAVGKLSVDARVDAALVGPNGVAVFYNDGSGGLGAGDVGAPTIQLVGQPSVTLLVGSAYSDAGATASDAVDGNLTSKIVVNNPVNPAVIGIYTVTYDVTDTSGNSAVRVTRAVQVDAQQNTTGSGGSGGGASGFAWVLFLALATILSRHPAWRVRRVSVSIQSRRSR